MKILGFHLVEKQGKRGKPKWQAWRSIGGKMKWVYIGDDQEHAESKIRAYCVKYGLEYLLDDTRGQSLDNTIGDSREQSQGLEDRVLLLELENKDLRREVNELRRMVEPAPALDDDAKLKALCPASYAKLAQIAGVGKSTVGDYFKGKGSQETRQEIYSAILETLYPAFVSRCREICQGLMERERTKSSPIWEIRQAMTEYPHQAFNDLLRRMEAERLCYFNEHSDPGSLTEDQRAGSLPDKTYGFVYYLVWR